MNSGLQALLALAPIALGATLLVAFVPGEQFYGENPERNHMRINFSFVSKEELAEAVRRPADYINKRM